MTQLFDPDEDLFFGRRPRKPAGTLSIAAYCPDGKVYGFAALSGLMAAGAYLATVRHDTGVVVAQGQMNPYLKFWIHGRLLSGKSPGDALQASLAEDPDADLRQVLLVAAGGRAAAHTGARTPSWGGHEIGAHHVVGGHGLDNETLVPAVARSLAKTQDTGVSLSARMLIALDEGLRDAGSEEAFRSAALQISGPGPLRALDLRIDDGPEPLSRLRTLYDAYQVEDGELDRFLATPDRPEGKIPTQLDMALIFLRRHWQYWSKQLMRKSGPAKTD